MYDVGSDRERDASCCHWHDLDTRRHPPHGLRQALCGSGAGPKHKTDVQKACRIPENPRCGWGSMSYDPNLPDIKIPRKVIQGRLASVRARTIARLSLRGEKFRRNDAANAFLSRRRDVTTDPVEIAMILAGILAVVAIVFVL